MNPCATRSRLTSWEKRRIPPWKEFFLLPLVAFPMCLTHRTCWTPRTHLRTTPTSPSKPTARDTDPSRLPSPLEYYFARPNDYFELLCLFPFAGVAELVDALDSGSSGQYACGGSSPPFRTRCRDDLVTAFFLCEFPCTGSGALCYPGLGDGCRA